MVYVKWFYLVKNKIKRKFKCFVVLIIFILLFLIIQHNHIGNIRDVAFSFGESIVEHDFVIIMKDEKNGSHIFDNEIFYTSGIYHLYVDRNIGLNIKISQDRRMKMIGIISDSVYVLVSSKEIDTFDVSSNGISSQFQIDYYENRVFYESENVKFFITKKNSVFYIEFDYFKDKKYGIVSNPYLIHLWIIKDNDIFSQFEGLHPQIDFLNSMDIAMKNSKISFVMEGCFFDSNSFDNVNRKIYLSLILARKKSLSVFIRPERKILNRKQMYSETLLVYSLYLRQQSVQKLRSNSKIVVFRNRYPPSLAKVSPEGAYLIHQQPWEFYSIPIEWIPYMTNVTSEIWVPSAYCKESFVNNKIPEDKIHVIPHGVYNNKYTMNFKPFNLPSEKKFKFLIIGSTFPRKGIDIALDVYVNLFNKSDDVSLIIHSTYGFYSIDEKILKAQNDPLAPEIIFMKNELSEIEIIRLIKSVNVYISSYRSEGFGMTILEAMAAGVPPIVTKYGPSLDFCPPSAVYFIDAKETDCFTEPCGKMKIYGTDSLIQYFFGAKTIIQSRWSEPSKESLAANMMEAYSNPEKLKLKSKMCKEHAEKYKWEQIAKMIIERIYNVTELNYSI